MSAILDRKGFAFQLECLNDGRSTWSGAALRKTVEILRRHDEALRESARLLQAALDDQREALGRLEEELRLEPAGTWHDDDGEALWWTVPITESPYVGSPLDVKFPWPDGAYPATLYRSRLPRVWRTPEYVTALSDGGGR